MRLNLNNVYTVHVFISYVFCKTFFSNGEMLLLLSFYLIPAAKFEVDGFLHLRSGFIILFAL